MHNFSIPYHFLSYCILSRGVTPLQPFILKKLIKSFTPLEVLYIYTCISFIIMSLIFYLFHKDHSRNYYILSKVFTDTNVLFLVLVTVIIFTLATLLKLFIYKNESIVKARPTLVAIGLIATLLWGFFIFKEDIKTKHIFACILLIAAVYILNK